MNRADLVFAICHMIGIRSHEAEVAGSAAAWGRAEQQKAG